MKEQQLKELILQSLEHEMAGVEIYLTAVQCATNGDLRHEWARYLDQTRNHVELLRGVCQAFGFDPEEETSGREVVRGIATALVNAMEQARATGHADAAQIVACEAVALAETKDHLDWDLLAACAEKLPASRAKVLKDAVEKAEDEEDEHLYHSRGWCRELWIEALGMQAVLPPPEERLHVKTAIGAARAEQAAGKQR